MNFYLASQLGSKRRDKFIQTSRFSKREPKGEDLAFQTSTGMLRYKMWRTIDFDCALTNMDKEYCKEQTLDWNLGEFSRGDGEGDGFQSLIY